MKDFEELTYSKMQAVEQGRGAVGRSLEGVLKNPSNLDLDSQLLLTIARAGSCLDMTKVCSAHKKLVCSAISTVTNLI